MLSDAQKRLFARHVLLDQLGAAGQARLCDAQAVPAAQSDVRAAEVALDYLARAGVQVGAAVAAADITAGAMVAVADVTAGAAVAAGEITAGAASVSADGAPHQVITGSAAAVSLLAGDPALLECAAWLSGAFAAVETIKQIAGVGTPARLDPELVLTGEVI